MVIQVVYDAKDKIQSKVVENATLIVDKIEEYADYYMPPDRETTNNSREGGSDSLQARLLDVSCRAKDKALGTIRTTSVKDVVDFSRGLAVTTITYAASYLSESATATTEKVGTSLKETKDKIVATETYLIEVVNGQIAHPIRTAAATVTESTQGYSEWVVRAVNDLVDQTSKKLEVPKEMISGMMNVYLLDPAEEVASYAKSTWQSLRGATSQESLMTASAAPEETESSNEVSPVQLSG